MKLWLIRGGFLNKPGDVTDFSKTLKIECKHQQQVILVFWKGNLEPSVYMKPQKKVRFCGLDKYRKNSRDCQHQCARSISSASGY